MKKQVVVAATNKSLGLPLIPESFISEWVKKQGKIEYTYLELEFFDTADIAWTEIAVKNGEVIILPTKDSWNKKELIEILMELSYDLQQEKYSGCSTHKHIVSEFIKAHGI